MTSAVRGVPAGLPLELAERPLVERLAGPAAAAQDQPDTGPGRPPQASLRGPARTSRAGEGLREPEPLGDRAGGDQRRCPSTCRRWVTTRQNSRATPRPGRRSPRARSVHIEPSRAVSSTRSSTSGTGSPRSAVELAKARQPSWRRCAAAGVGALVPTEGVGDVLAVRPGLHQAGGDERGGRHVRAVPGVPHCRVEGGERRPRRRAARSPTRRLSAPGPRPAAALTGRHDLVGVAHGREGGAEGVGFAHGERRLLVEPRQVGQRVGHVPAGRRGDQGQVGAVDQPSEVGVLGGQVGAERGVEVGGEWHVPLLTTARRRGPRRA